MVHKLVEETDDAFTVDDGAGAFKIAKAGLSEDLLGKIRGYADGGEIAPALTGDPTTDALLARAEPPPVLPSSPVAPSDVTLTGDPAIDAQIAGADLSGPSPTGMDPILGAEWVRRFAAANGRPPTREDLIPQPWVDLPIPRTAPLVQPGTVPTEPVGTTDLIVPGPQVPPAPMPSGVAGGTAGGTTPAGGGGGGFAVPRVQGEIAAGRAQQAAGLEEQARVAAAEGERQAQILAETERRRAAAQSDYEGRLKDLQSKGDALYQNIIDKKVDPRRLWNDSSTGSKVTASIGMILGGIGSALTGGPNYAVEIIDRAIARDIDSQKTEIEKGQNLLAHNLKKTDDLRMAHQLTRADLLDSSAAQLQVASASFAGQKAKAAATAAVGNLRAEAAKERQAVAAQSMQMAAQARLLPLQVEQAERQVAMQKLQMAALSQVLSGVGSTIDSRALAFLPDDIRERVVQLPGGKAAMAPTKEDAGKVREAIEAVTEINGAISDMRAFRKTHSGGTMLPAAASASTATALALRNKMVRAMGKGLGVLNASDYELLFGMIPDPAAFFRTDNAVNAALDVLQQSSNDKMGSAIKARLIGYQDSPRVRVSGN